MNMIFTEMIVDYLLDLILSNVIYQIFCIPMSYIKRCFIIQTYFKIHFITNK